MATAVRTEHNGAKNGGGYWGRREEAKRICRSKRRREDQRLCRQAKATRGVDDR